MKHDFLVYLSHSWGTTPEQKKAEHEYNVNYYREHKDKWKKYREERLKELDDEELSIQRSEAARNAALDSFIETDAKVAKYNNTIKLLEKQYEKETDPKRRRLLNSQIMGLKFTRASLQTIGDVALETAMNFDRGKLAIDYNGRVYEPSPTMIESDGRRKTRGSIKVRKSYLDNDKRVYDEIERWEDPYAARERDRAKAYGENEKAKLEVQRKKSKK